MNHQHSEEHLNELDQLIDKFANDRMLDVAQKLLSKKDQDENEFLGAQGVLLLNGLL